MFGIGKLLSTAVKIVNVPLRVVENVCTDNDIREDERIISMPLNTLAKELEKVDEDFE